MSIVEAASSHPLSVGIRKRCEVEAQGSRAVDLVTSEEVAGRGLVATVTAAGAPYEVVIGNEALMTDLGAAYASVEIEQRCIASMTSWQSEAKSVILLALRRLDAAASPLSALSDDKLTVLALFGLHDPPRDEAAAVVAELRSRGIEVWMCTGDNTATAQAVATRVGINPACIQAHALPEDKRSLVQRLQGVSKRRVVAFCGDGINDSPALAQADAGIAMGGGSAVALRAAHFTLVGSSLWGLVTLRSLSRSTIRKIYANFAWASVYNVVLIPLAAGALSVADQQVHER
jgi:cation transport ATPase